MFFLTLLVVPFFCDCQFIGWEDNQGNRDNNHGNRDNNGNRNQDIKKKYGEKIHHPQNSENIQGHF